MMSSTQEKKVRWVADKPLYLQIKNKNQKHKNAILIKSNPLQPQK